MFICLCVSLPACVCFMCVHYHLHWVCEHHTVEADEVLVVQGVHGVDLTDEIFQSVRLVEHICLQTLHSYVHLKESIKILYDSFKFSHVIHLSFPTLSVLFNCRSISIQTQKTYHKDSTVAYPTSAQKCNQIAQHLQKNCNKVKCFSSSIKQYQRHLVGFILI